MFIRKNGQPYNKTRNQILENQIFIDDALPGNLIKMKESAE